MNYKTLCRIARENGYNNNYTFKNGETDISYIDLLDWIFSSDFTYLLSGHRETYRNTLIFNHLKNWYNLTNMEGHPIKDLFEDRMIRWFKVNGVYIFIYPSAISKNTYILDIQYKNININIDKKYHTEIQEAQNYAFNYLLSGV